MKTLNRILTICFLLGADCAVLQAQLPNLTGWRNRYEQIVALPTEQQTAQLQKLISDWHAQKIPTDSIYVGICLETAKQLADNGQMPDAAKLLQETEAVYRHTPREWLNTEDQIKLYYRLGRYLNKSGHAETAYKKLVAGIALGKQYPNSRWTSFALSYAAFLLNTKGDYEQAVQYARQAVVTGENAHDGFATSNALFEKSKALESLGRIHEIEPDMKRAVRLLEKDGTKPFDLSLYYVYLAYISQANKQSVIAIDYFKKAIALNLKSQNKDGLADNYNNLGYFLQGLGSYDESIYYLERAINLYTNEYGGSLALANLGRAYKLKKNYTKALTLYQQSIKTLATGFSPRNLTALPTRQAIQSVPYKVYLLSFIQEKADTWLDWAKATNNRSYLKNALDTYQLADELIDFMRWEHTGQQSKLFWREKTRGMYERAIETCYQLKDSSNAFRFFEKSRAVMLADKLNELGARQKLPSAQADQEQLFRQKVTALQSQLADTKTRPDSLQTALNTAQDNLDRFLKQLETSNPAYYRYKYDNTVPELPNVQHWLGQQKASLVSYFVGDSALYVLGITPTGAKLIQRPVAQYRQETAAFRQLLADANAQNRNFGQYKTLAHSLYQQLLAPLGLPDGRVVVSPDGFFLPLDALSRRADQPDFLVNHYAFSYTYSARLLLKDPDRATSWNFPGRQRAFLGMAPVRFSAGLAALPGSDNALAQIGNGFSWPTLLTGSTATRRAFLSQSPGHRVIQLFTHADADTSRKVASEEPVLFFADSSLRLSDLNNQQPFGAELLVLSACRTGLGANQQGEGVFSLARGFASLGIPSIGTTLWSVENQATYRLTELFYEFLQQGLPKDVALQRAKQQFMTEGDAANQLPARWAGLILVGDAAPLSQGWPGWVWALVGVGVLGLVFSQRKHLLQTLRR